MLTDFFYIIFPVLIINSGLLIYFTGNTISSLAAFLNRYFYLLTDIISLLIVSTGIYYFYRILINKYELNKNFIIIILAVLPLLNIFINIERNNLSRFYLSYDNALNIFKTLKQNDILFTRLDCPTYDIYYMQYSKKVIDHFMHPHNQGVIKNADGIGVVGNPVCGDIMKIYIKVEKNKSKGEFIKDIKFETLGCAAAIATSSMVTDLAKGKSLKDALKISRNDVSQNLEGLPPIKMHCSNLASDALKAAILNYQKKIKKRLQIK